MRLLRYIAYTILSVVPGIRLVRTRLLHLDMYLDVKTPGISKSLFVNKTREDDMIYLIGKFLPAKGDIVDCGANMGFYPLLEKKFLSKDAGRRIICVEPDPRNISVLKKNISVFGDESFEIIPGAVSDRNGLMNLDVSRESNLNFITSDGDNDAAGCVSVETFSLDTLIRRYDISPSFLRMDIEGHEVEVFNGAQEWAKTCVAGSTILFETHSPMYEHEDSLMNSLLPFKEFGFAVKCLVSSGGAGDEIKKRWGFDDGDEFVSDGFEREMFWDVDFDTACEIASAKPKLTRYMLLIKEA